EPGADLLVPLQKGARRGDRLLDVAAHVLRLVEARLLGDVADGEAGGEARRAEEVFFDADHDAQQGALARAVAADDADLGPRVEGEPDVLQDLAFAVSLAEVFDGKDVLFSHAGPVQSR